MNKKFNISVISKACGILPHTLRAWENRYNMFSPGRDENGKRVYSEQDLKKAVCLATLVDDGHSISSLAGYTIAELEKLSKSLDDQKALGPKKITDVGSKNLLKYLEAYQLDKVAGELQHLRQSQSAKDFILKTILPTMRDIGTFVANGKYTVTQEHIMSTIVRDQLSQISIPNFDEKTTQLAIATPEGNLHELAIIIANILCRSHKMTTRYLGAAHPAECLSEAINILKTPVLVLGTVTSDSWNYSQEMIPYLKKLDEKLEIEIDVILGGGFALDFPTFNNIRNVIPMSTFEDFDNYLATIY